MNKTARLRPDAGVAARCQNGCKPARSALDACRGVTLLEMMIVVMIVAILTGIVTAAARKIQTITTETRFVSQLRIVTSAFEQRSFQE